MRQDEKKREKQRRRESTKGERCATVEGAFVDQERGIVDYDEPLVHASATRKTGREAAFPREKEDH